MHLFFYFFIQLYQANPTPARPGMHSILRSQDTNKTSDRQTSGSVQARLEVTWMPTKHARNRPDDVQAPNSLYSVHLANGSE